MNDLPPKLPCDIEDKPPVKFRQIGFLVAVLAIAICIAFVLFANSLRTPSGVPRTGSNAVGELQTRYIIGMQQVMEGAKEKAEVEKFLDTRDKGEKDNGALFRNEILRSVFKKARAGESPRMAELVKDSTSLKKDLDSLQELESKGAAMDAGDWERLLKRHGAAVRLARAQATEWKEDDWSKLKAQCIVTVALLAFVSLGGIGAVLGGVGLLINLGLRWKRGLLVSKMRSVDSRFASVLLEAFAIYFFPFVIGLSLLQIVAPRLPTGVSYGVALIFVVIATYWPRLRGMKRDEWKEALGLHCGAGVFKEIGIGALGWVAGLPVVVIGALLGTLISSATGLDATHPIVDSLREPGWHRWYLIFLAAVWAPVVEELMFRGLLFPALSARGRWFIGAVGSAFIFAVIHPQGWAGIPALMALATTMSSLRQLRGSIIAPIAAHALNNGLISVLLINLF